VSESDVTFTLRSDEPAVDAAEVVEEDLLTEDD
jgi:hypothetical protein